MSNQLLFHLYKCHLNLSLVVYNNLFLQHVPYLLPHMTSQSSWLQMAVGKPGIKSQQLHSIHKKINFCRGTERQWGQSIQCQILKCLLYACASQAEEIYKTVSWLALQYVQFDFMFYFSISLIFTHRICLIFQPLMMFFLW